MVWSSVTILWIYILLPAIGGVTGYLRSHSQISLVTSLVFSVILALFCASGVLPFIVSTWLLLFLLVFFGWRFARTKRFMPAGFLVIVTVLALALPRFPG